jgi:CRISPR-associated endonuclease Cas2
LRSLLTPVQKSVFEGEISTRQYPGLLEMITEIIDLETDTVRVYHLSAGACQLTEHIGTSIHVEPRDEDIIL